MIDNKLIPDRKLTETTEAGRIANFFGFQPINPPTVEKQDLDNTKNFNNSYYPSEKAALLRMYFDEKMMSGPQPSMLYCARPFKGLKEKRKPNRLECSLVSLGSYKSVCECLSIETGMAILNSLGYKNLEVEINSIGDKESIGEFQKRLASFVRKHYNSFSAELKQAIKKDITAVFRSDKKEWENLECECPKSIDFLSEASRCHFKELLEFLEVINIPYQINHRLIGDLDIGSEIIFAIKSEGEELAHGFRFNKLAKKVGCKKDLPATIFNISAKLKKRLKRVKMKPAKPQFYLIQFGPEAKLKSFLILRELYKAGASVIHSIAKDKLGSQMSVAENSEIPYILLMGQKEALENSVVIRNNLTRAQEIVSLPEFASKIKELI